MKLNIPDADFFVVENFLPEPDKAFNWLIANEDWQQYTHNGYKAPRLNKQYGKAYSYSGVSTKDSEIPAHYQRLITTIANATGFTGNQILLNLYEANGSIGLHSDSEPELGYNPTIVSLSLGSDCIFTLVNNKTKAEYNVKLKANSLLVMGNMSQVLYRHQIKRGNIKGKRISLTFRQIK
ncbi:alpha-ketoglutarate-dependent dioxygenase AlkB [uncultured Flavobacterium sp.]|uniref:alpha-ketoglutarate-dependent dioxygenase AlkB n=1 Tax=uncultured Flavobacterium sp. TaxID=165435 RepID=UPI002594DFD4|nr:alpha-ketoglutarate-dependent dioxygenase AlkB [uncultured Flavobacterium sp.]